jgi:hypothetical protein
VWQGQWSTLENSTNVLKQSSRPVTIFWPQALHQSLRGLASQNERSLTGEIRYVLKKYTEDPYSFGN